MLSKFFDFLGRVECYDGSDDDDHGRHLGILERLGGTVGESGDSCVTCVHDVAPFCRVFSVFSHPPMAQRGSRQLRTRNRRLGQRLYDGLQWMNRLGRRRDNCFTNSTGIGTTVAAAAVAVAESGSMMDGTDFGRSLVFLFHMGIGRVAGGRNWSSGGGTRNGESLAWKTRGTLSKVARTNGMCTEDRSHDSEECLVLLGGHRDGMQQDDPRTTAVTMR